MSRSYAYSHQQTVDDYAQKVVKCDNCHRENSIPMRCNHCSADLPLLSQDDTRQNNNAPKSKVSCDRCGRRFKRVADRDRHQRFSCPVKTDATDEEWFYCHLRGAESCSERGYRPDKLSDHLRQVHGFGRVDKGQVGGAAGSSSQGQGQGEVVPPEQNFEAMTIGPDLEPWYHGESASQGGLPEPGTPEPQSQYPQQSQPSLPPRHDNLYGFPYDSNRYDDNPTASLYPLTTDPSALDSNSRGMSHRNRYPATPYHDPSNPSGLAHVADSSYPMAAGATTQYSHRQQHQQQGPAAVSGDANPYSSADLTSWNSGDSGTQTMRSHRRGPESAQYPTHPEPGQRRQRRNRGDEW